MSKGQGMKHIEFESKVQSSIWTTINFDKKALSSFVEYLRIKTVQPNPDYEKAVKFLKAQAAELSLPCQVVEPHLGKPVVVMTWLGKQPELTSVMLNSHIDVVPVFSEFWKYDPFSATIDEKGDIYARGSQDMKCVGIQYLEAIRRLQATGYQPQRTIQVTFVPDEEIGGVLGMELFVKHDLFRQLRVGFCMDEGLASPTEEYPVYYGERSPWWIKVTCQGQPGHGSQFLADTAGEKLNKVLNTFFKFRESERLRLAGDTSLTLGETVTLNLTRLEGGVQYNVVPAELACGFDIRLPPTLDLTEFEGRLRSWLAEAGDNIRMEFLQKSMCQATTSVEESKNPWWKAFCNVTRDLNMKTKAQIFPAATDARFLRSIGIPAIGFSPMNHTPVLLHDHNEFLNRDIFLTGIGFYEKLIPALCSVHCD